MSEKDNAQSEAEWHIHHSDTGVDDPLLACLIWFTKLENRPFSAQALVAGLPLENNRLTPSLSLRAAERAGLAAQIVRRPLNNFTPLVLPTILLLKDKRACVLLKIMDKNKAQIIQPETGTGVNEISFAELGAIYTGYAIFIRPAYKFSDRSDETLEQKPRRWFWDVILRVWPIYGEVLVASFLVNMFALAVPLFIMNVYDRVVPNNAVETLWVLAIGVGLVFCFDFCLRTLRGYFLDVASKKVDVRLSADIFEQVLGIQMASRPSSVGAFANTVQSFEIFRDFITSSTATVLVDLPFAILYIIIITIIGGTLAFVPLFAIPLLIAVGWLLQSPLTNLTKEQYQHAAEKHAVLIESLGGVETIKSVGAEGPMQRRWERVVTVAARLGTKLRFLTNLNINFSLFLQQATSIVIVIFGVYKIGAGEITVGALIACTILSSRALAPMSQIAGLLMRYYQSINSLTSLNKVMSLPVERGHGKSVLHRPKLQGEIELKSVSFSYPEQKTPALHNVSFKIKSGEHVGIIGRIGSGKTTITKLFLGLYKPTEGTILFDGTELNQIDPAELRHNVGYVPQDIVLFYGTVKENIMLGAPYVDDSAILTAALAGGVDSFVSQNPEGFDMQVGERGSRLSGGQRQCVAIARAFLLDPPIIVLDEPTNSMDDHSEAQFKLRLTKFAANKTLILSTHRVSMLSLVERLIVLESGQVIADGQKEEVLKALTEGRLRVAKTQVRA